MNVSSVIKRWMMSFIALVICCGGLQAATTEVIHLAANGKTDFLIVKPSEATPIDVYAVETLAKYLEESTGAEFPVVDPAEVAGERPAIFVGLSAPALKRLDVINPLADLSGEEHVCRSKGKDVFLYGKGVHGQLWAVMDFLRKAIGWRWFTPFEHPVIESKSTLVLQPFNRTTSYSYTGRRMQLLFNTEFYYLHAVNQGWEAKNYGSAFVSMRPTTGFLDTVLHYVPPTQGHKGAKQFDGQDKKNYFETNPDFFTLDESGRRVPDRQLCFSNSELRNELTRRVFKDIARAKSKGWGDMCVTVTPWNVPGEFCHCPGCQVLVDKYQCPSGPHVDYLIELCGILDEEYPDVMVKTEVYRQPETLQPVVMPKGGTLPENLIVAFAPVDDPYFADWWNHRAPELQTSFRDLLGWSRISRNLMAWFYPNPWRAGSVMPVGNLERIVNNLRLMHYAGVRWVFVDHPFILYRSGFSELQRYLMCNLMRDIDCDSDEVIREFTDHHYGRASELMRTYIHELEQCRIEMDMPMDAGYDMGGHLCTFNIDDVMFPYLTPDNIHRWQVYFDEMEALTAGTPEKLLNVRKERRELDMATLWKWFQLAEEYPAHYTDYRVHESRIKAVDAALYAGDARVRPIGEQYITDFVNTIKEDLADEAPLSQQR